jgi:calcineurin-like phosphoesterase
MCGAYNGVIGFEKNSVMNKILFGQASPFEIDDNAKKLVDAVVIDVDEETGRAKSIQALSYLEGKRIV